MNYAHVATNSTGANLAKVGAKLRTITINSKGATSNLLTVYDNALGDTSGDVIAIIDTTVGPGTFRYDCETRKGLSYVLAAGTAADITFCWS